MQIFKCLFAGSECLCDSGVVFQEEDCMFVVKGKYMEIGNEDFGISSNVDEDAEEGAAGEGTDSKKQKVIDIIHNNSLTETSFEKKAYMAYIKGYLKNLVDHMKENGKSDEDIKAFQSSAQTFIKKVLGSFDDYQFFYPDMSSDDADYDTAMVILCKWDGETPYFYYFKDGLKAEKV